MDSWMKAIFVKKKKNQKWGTTDSAYGTIEPSTGEKQLNPIQEWKQDKLE